MICVTVIPDGGEKDNLFGYQITYVYFFLKTG